MENVSIPGNLKERKKMQRNLLFISGYAKLPKGTTAHELYGGLILGLVVERESGRIIEAECSLATQVAVGFVRDALLGKTLRNVEEIEITFNQIYFGAAKKAILSALSICTEKYRQILGNEHIYEETQELID